MSSHFGHDNFAPLTITTPPVAGPLTAVVETNGVFSNGNTGIQIATVTPGVNQSTAAATSPLSITGAGFDPTASNNRVTFSDGVTVSGSITVGGSNTSLSVPITIPATATAGPLMATVTTDGVSYTATQVGTITPVITGPNSNVAASASTITITGHYFDPTANNNSVLLTNASGTVVGTGYVLAATPTQLTVALTSVPTAGPLYAVVTTDGVSSASTQVATITPVVTSSTASLNYNSTSIVINGLGFDPSQTATTSVVFSNIAAPLPTASTIVVNSATQMTVTFNVKPTTLGVLKAAVTVDTAAGTATSVATVVPVVTASASTAVSSTPSAGSPLVITGSGFPASGNTVTLSNGAGYSHQVTGLASTATGNSRSISVNLSGLTLPGGPLYAVVTDGATGTSSPAAGGHGHAHGDRQQHHHANPQFAVGGDHRDGLRHEPRKRYGGPQQRGGGQRDQRHGDHTQRLFLHAADDRR